ncbi:helix-turn-helix domain-containing protein [Solibacillus faecavium]|nr:Rgg/GadR/MutR family transcriptional regulator [Solibacillus faecavium]
MNNIGETIKRLRLAKKIPSQSLYTDLLSRQARSNFEKGESDTTVSKFFILLDRLNISLDEFYVLHTQKESVEFHLFTDIASVYYKKDIEGLILLINKLSEEYKRTNNIKYYHYKIMVENMLRILKNESPSEDFEQLSNYLMNCDSWGYYEIMLFSNSINYFSQDLIDIVFKRSKDIITNFRILRRYRNEYAMLLLNIINKNILESNFPVAVKYYKEYEEMEEVLQNDMYFQTMRIYFREVLEIVTNKKRATEDLEKVITYLGYFNMSNKQKQCIALLEKLNFQVEKKTNKNLEIAFQITKK